MVLRSPRQRLVTALLGLGVLAVLAVAVACRERLAAAWHLQLLQDDPGHLDPLLEHPEGLGRDLAIRTYLESEQGRKCFLEAFLSLHEDAIRSGATANQPIPLPAAISAGMRKGMPDYETGEIILLAKDDPSDVPKLFLGFLKEGASMFGEEWRSRREEHGRVRGFERYLELLRGAPFASDRFPGKRFLLLPGDEAGLRTGFYASVTTGTSSIRTLVKDRPPDFMTPADMAALHRATALLIEVESGGSGADAAASDPGR
jgi:hypothetical protein